MYMSPALVGRVFGLFAAHLALLAQNALILGSIFYLMTTIGRGWAPACHRHSLRGPFDRRRRVAFRANRARRAFPAAIRARCLASLPAIFEQHGAALLGCRTTLCRAGGSPLCCCSNDRRHPMSQPSVFSVAGLAFWSPLAVIPVVPLAALQPRELLAAGASIATDVARSRRVGGFPAHPCLYGRRVVVDCSRRPRHGSRLRLLVFCSSSPYSCRPSSSWLVHGARCPRRLARSSSSTGLFSLPCRSSISAPNNDLVMRGSIAPLAIVAFVFGSVVVDLTRKRSIAGFVGWMLVAATVPLRRCRDRAFAVHAPLCDQRLLVDGSLAGYRQQGSADELCGAGPPDPEMAARCIGGPIGAHRETGLLAGPRRSAPISEPCTRRYRSRDDRAAGS